METVLRPLIAVGGPVVVALVLSWAVDRLLRRADARHQDTPLWDLLRRCRQPLLTVMLSAALRGSYQLLRYDRVRSHHAALSQVLTLILIGSGAWLVVRASSAVAEASYAKYATSSRDAARLRRVRTQVTLIMRIVTAVVAVIATAAMLLTFPDLRAVGTSMLASAGVIGIVAGVAAQSTLGNLFAGFQIAFGDMVRIGDTVVVSGEWGVIDEVTLTYLSVRTWDERRITMPVSYFTSQPFENWSRGGAQMTGTVFFHLDHRAPIPRMRDKLRDILRDCPAWDGRDWGLAVTDSTPSTIEVRAMMTAKDAADIWTLRVTVREHLIRWLAEHHPYALPRISTGPAAPVPADARHHPLLKDGRVPRTGLG